MRLPLRMILFLFFDDGGGGGGGEGSVWFGCGGECGVCRGRVEWGGGTRDN